MDYITDIPMRTPVPLLKLQGTLSHSTPVLALGSCFSDNIGKQLRADLFDVAANPFGPLFNPVSVADALSRIIENRKFTSADLECNPSGVWFSFDLYTRFSSVNSTKVINLANEALENARRVLFSPGKAPIVLITFGTAWRYTLSESCERTVANCHKLPRERFNRSRLTVEEITALWNDVIDNLRHAVPGVKIIITVSPVRHLADGFHDNALSKSILLLAAECIARSEYVEYYPAYEILTDDLRDYRFYAADLIHPSDSAIDYIYSHFIHSLCSNEEITIIRSCRSLWNRFSHRPLTDNPAAHSAFLRESTECAHRLADRYPQLNHTIEALLRINNQSLDNEL